MMEKYNINQTTLKILGLYSNDYSKRLHLREIARETGVDVKAVQLQLKRLEKTNILSSILRGRNKEYCLNLNNSITRYYMVMAETFVSIRYLRRNFLIKKIVDEIGNTIDDIIVLFGSFARNQATKSSDIDLFVISEKKPDRTVAEEAGDIVGRRVSVKFASKKQFMNGLIEKDPLICEVVSNHIVLKGVDDFTGIIWRYYAGR
jgi:predicted nucleotidyltransferase